MSEPAPLACPVCATTVVPGARFCFSCGTALDRPADDDTVLLAERRVVTVLFGDLSDFTAWAEDLDPERVGVVTDRVLAGLAAAVQAYGGHVDKLTGDGIMAVFGAPTAHEDDAERAVRAAQRMQDEVRRLVADEGGGGHQLGLRVGLNTGEVLAGVQASLSYTVVGDTVNTASRLSDAAATGVVTAGRETAAATMAVASWQALPPMRLKGKREAVVAYQLLALRPRASTRLGLGDEAPLVGREAELGLLVSKLLDAVERRRPGSVLLTGEAGVGKSRLARELERFAADVHRARVLVGHCAPYGVTSAVAPLVETVRTICGIEDADDDDTARSRVLRTVGRLQHPTLGPLVGSSIAERLNALLGLEPADDAAARDYAAPNDVERREDVAGTLVTLYEAVAAQGPLVLVLDDLHWADDGLLDLVGQVAQRVTGPVVLMLVGRPELLMAHGGWVAQLPDPVLLPLAPLEAPASERLLRAYLGGQALDDGVAQLLVDRAQGNPFFLAELLQLMVDRGLLLRRADGAWGVDGAVPETVLPAGVQAVLAARIDGLSAPAKATLRDASVLGATFWPGALAVLGGLDDDELRRRLDELVGRDIVRGSDDGLHSFAHTLTQQVAYGGIAKADRARRHAAAAQWAAASMPGPASEVDPYVGAQAERAIAIAAEMGLLDSPGWSEVAARGFDALRRLGLSALTRDDNAAAVELLDRALALVGPAGDAVREPAVLRTRVAWAESLAGLHRLGAAEAALAPALEVGADPSARAEALVVLGDVRRKQGDDDGAAVAFVRALSDAGERGDDRTAGRALRELGLLDFFSGRLVDAEARFAQALELAERGGDKRGKGWALQHLAWSQTTRADYDSALTSLASAAETFATFKDSGGIGWCAGTEAMVRMLQGRHSVARALAGGVLPLAEASLDRWGAAACLSIMALSGCELGDVTVARGQAEQALEQYRDLGDSWGSAMALVALGMCDRAVGDADSAVVVLRTAADLAERARHPTVHSMALLALGWALHDVRDLDGAERAALEALRVTRSVRVARHGEAGERVLLALVLRARGRLDEALAELEPVVAAPPESTLLFPLRQALAHYAGTLLEAGRIEEGLAAAEKAVAAGGEDIRSEAIALRALGVARAAAEDRNGAEEALRASVIAASATEHVVERAASQRALDELLAGGCPAPTVTRPAAR